MALVLLCTFNISCEDDDDFSNNDPLVGTWALFEVFENNVEFPIEFCEDQEVLTFRRNGVFEDEFFVEDFNFNCVTDEIIVGSWEYDGGDDYIFVVYGEVEIQNIVFIDNNTFSIIDAFTFNGFTFTEEYIYIRI